MENKTNVQIRFEDIIESSFYMHNPKEDTTLPFNRSDYIIEIKKGVNISPKENTLMITMSFSIKSRLDTIANPIIKKDGKLPSLFYEGMCIYKINGIDLIFKPGTKKFNVPIELIHHLASVSYSTFRGIIFSKSSNSLLRQVFLPSLNQTQIAELMQPDKTPNLA